MVFLLNATLQQVDKKWAKEQSLIKRCFFWKHLMSNWTETICIKWSPWEILLYLRKERLRFFLIQEISSDYKKNNKKQAKKILAKKFTRKRCPRQLNIKFLTRNNLTIKHFGLLILNDQKTAHFCDTVKKKQKSTKGNIPKITNILRILVAHRDREKTYSKEQSVVQ